MNDILSRRRDPYRDGHLTAGSEYKRCVVCCKYDDKARSFQFELFRVWGCVPCTRTDEWFNMPVLPIPIEDLFYE